MLCEILSKSKLINVAIRLYVYFEIIDIKTTYIIRYRLFDDQEVSSSIPRIYGFYFILLLLFLI